MSHSTRDRWLKARSWLTRFRDSRMGNVGIIFGLAVTPVLVGAGAAIDYSRASALLSSLQAGTDATTLLLCQDSPTIAVADLRIKAQASIQTYVTGGTVAIDDLQVTNAPRSVSLKASSTYPTAFMKLVNQSTVPVAARAGCTASEQYFEIAMVMDTTGSMASTGGGTSKMEAAKTAATQFVDYMYSTGALPGHVRMSLVPFAQSVALPTSLRTSSWLDTTAVSPLHWQYVTNPGPENFTSRLSIFNKLALSESSWAWQGCVESPVYPFNVKDDAVSTATPGSMILPLFAPDEVHSKDYTRTNLNSYIDDGLAAGSGQSCRNDDPSNSKRFTQACKYTARKNVDDDKAGPNWACTTRPLSQLGTGQTSLKSEIGALQPLGGTNAHEGFMWGWRTISPTSVFAGQSAPPVAYGTPSYNKVIVLMTDGENQWLANSNTIGKSHYSAYGYFRKPDGTDPTSSNSRFRPSRTNLSTDAHGRAAIDELLIDACTNAKAKGVIVYVVGFSTPSDPIDAQGQTLLSNCSSGNGFYFMANSSSDLISAFDKIAKGIGALRLTK